LQGFSYEVPAAGKSFFLFVLGESVIFADKKMSKSRERHPIIWALQRKGLSVNSLCLAIGSNKTSFYGYIRRPSIMPFTFVVAAAGFLSMDPVVLFYLILRNKRQLKKGELNKVNELSSIGEQLYSDYLKTLKC
jgi:hypothetical protein